MKLNEYQQLSLETDQLPSAGERRDDESVIAPLLGLAGEAGELLTEYKKHLRDGPAYRLFQERVAEELGDLLWYLSNLASKFGLELDEVAELNLKKTRERWLESTRCTLESFDSDFPEHERLPRRFEVELRSVEIDGRKKMRALIDGEQVGDDLTDNAYDRDGYRFHDVFHYAFAAMLGWSPVVRGLLNRKRKSRSEVDEVEDGGRAAAIEEGISAIIFDHAKGRSFYGRCGGGVLRSPAYDPGRDNGPGGQRSHVRRVGECDPSGI